MWPQSQPEPNDLQSEAFEDSPGMNGADRNREQLRQDDLLQYSQKRTRNGKPFASWARGRTRCPVLLLAALQIGNSIDRLSEFTGYPKQFVGEVCERMQEAELWVEEQVRCDHWKRKFEGNVSFDVDFWMDVLVALGSWTRELRDDGEYSYFQVGPEPADEIFRQ
jgi:hypothetical protein